MHEKRIFYSKKNTWESDKIPLLALRCILGHIFRASDGLLVRDHVCNKNECSFGFYENEKVNN